MIKGVSGKILKDPYFGYLLSGPLLGWVIGTIFYPLIEALNLSFRNVGFVGSGGRYIGLQNYIYIFQQGEFWSSLLTSITWTMANVSLQLLLAFISALILNQEFVGQRLIRNWIILPWVLPSIVLATMGRWILDPSIGVVNYILRSLNIISAPILFLSSPKYALLTVTLINVWRWFPFYAVIILAALQAVPLELYEASVMDGASAFKRLRYITLPMIMPVLKVLILISSLWAINMFDIIWLLTRGGPSDRTTILTILIYRKGFQEFRISQASTIAILMFILLLIFGLIYFRKLEIELE